MPIITTSACLPPLISFGFSTYLLDPLFGMKVRVEETIIPLSLKKIRSQDVGKRKEFDKLLKEYQEVYGRKKNEEAEYKAKIKEAAEKRPRFPNAGSTMRFKRF